MSSRLGVSSSDGKLWLWPHVRSTFNGTVLRHNGRIRFLAATDVEDLAFKPPYHPDGVVSMQFASAEFVARPPLSLTYEQCFLYRR